MVKNRDRLYGNQFVNIRNSELFLSRYSVLDLAKEFGTPSFFFLEEKIIKNITKIQSCFNEVFEKSSGFYSVKSNFLKEILSTVKDVDFGVEVISLQELKILDEVNFPSNKILVGGPFLPDELISQIIIRKIPLVVIYDLNTLIRFQKIYNSMNENNDDGNKKIHFLLRIRNKKYGAKHGVIFSEDNIQRLGEILKKTPLMQYKGLLSHYGTRLKIYSQYLENLKNLMGNAKKLKEIIGLDTSILNLGGGFPSADSIKKTDLIQNLNKLKIELKENGFENCSIFYEPGRNIVSDCGFCITQVYKIEKEISTIFVDIGNNYIPKFMKSSLRFYNASQITETHNTPIDIMGYIPSDQDILIKNYSFTPSIEVGDYVMIANVGAYALTWSTRFPYPKPKIIYLKKDKKIISKIDY